MDLIKHVSSKTFYLDLRGYRGELLLANDLKLLGMKQETFLSKDVSFVVTNRVPLKVLSLNQSTPKSSPQCFTDYMYSPECSNSPATDQNTCPKSRGLALLQKANKQKKGTTDLLEVCKQFKIKVYHLEKILIWLKKYKSKKFAPFRLQEILKRGSEKLPDLQKIKSPFIKIEDVERKHMTRHKVFHSWSDIISPALSRNISEIHRQFKKTGNIDFSFRPVRQNDKENSVGAKQKNSLKNSKLIKSKSLLTQNAQHKKQIAKHLTHEEKKKNSKKKPKRHYCEICSVHYTNLDEHLLSKPHIKFMSDSSQYLVVGNIISAITDSKLFGNSVSSPFHTMENDCNKENLDFQCFQSGAYDEMIYNPNFNALGPLPDPSCQVSDYCTEPYDADTFISASCSSLDVAPFPFLEKNKNGAFVSPTKTPFTALAENIDSKETLYSKVEEMVNVSSDVISLHDNPSKCYNKLIFNHDEGFNTASSVNDITDKSSILKLESENNNAVVPQASFGKYIEPEINYVGLSTCCMSEFIYPLTEINDNEAQNNQLDFNKDSMCMADTIAIVESVINKVSEIENNSYRLNFEVQDNVEFKQAGTQYSTEATILNINDNSIREFFLAEPPKVSSSIIQNSFDNINVEANDYDNIPQENQCFALENYESDNCSDSHQLIGDEDKFGSEDSSYYTPVIRHTLNFIISLIDNSECSDAYLYSESSESIVDKSTICCPLQDGKLDNAINMENESHKNVNIAIISKCHDSVPISPPMINSLSTDFHTDNSVIGLCPNGGESELQPQHFFTMTSNTNSANSHNLLSLKALCPSSKVITNLESNRDRTDMVEIKHLVQNPDHSSDVDQMPSGIVDYNNVSFSLPLAGHKRKYSLICNEDVTFNISLDSGFNSFDQSTILNVSLAEDSTSCHALDLSKSNSNIDQDIAEVKEETYMMSHKKRKRGFSLLSCCYNSGIQCCDCDKSDLLFEGQSVLNTCAAHCNTEYLSPPTLELCTQISDYSSECLSMPHLELCASDSSVIIHEIVSHDTKQKFPERNNFTDTNSIYDYSMKKKPNKFAQMDLGAKSEFPARKNKMTRNSVSSLRSIERELNPYFHSKLIITKNLFSRLYLNFSQLLFTCDESSQENDLLKVFKNSSEMFCMSTVDQKLENTVLHSMSALCRSNLSTSNLKQFIIGHKM